LESLIIKEIQIIGVFFLLAMIFWQGYIEIYQADLWPGILGVRIHLDATMCCTPLISGSIIDIILMDRKRIVRLGRLAQMVRVSRFDREGHWANA
jgi:hypothetical protein